MEAAAAREEEEEREKAAAAIKEVRDKLDALVMQDEEPKDASNSRIATEESKDSGNGLRKIDTMRKSNKKKRNRKSGKN